jgi:hypothetical protein
VGGGGGGEGAEGGREGKTFSSAETRDNGGMRDRTIESKTRERGKRER